MSREPVRIQTRVSLVDVGRIFRESMKVSRLSEYKGQGTTFEKPHGDVFDELDGDPADFSVMALLGGGGATLQKSAVHMYAWDRGSHREIVLSVGKNLAALGIKANGKMRAFVVALQTVDPTTEFSGLGVSSVEGATASTTSPGSPAQWSADPFGRHQYRYWNGTRWTENVSDAGVQATDPPVSAPPPPPA